MLYIYYLIYTNKYNTLYKNKSNVITKVVYNICLI